MEGRRRRRRENGRWDNLADRKEESRDEHVGRKGVTEVMGNVSLVEKWR